MYNEQDLGDITREKTLDFYIRSFKNGDFDFIVKGYDMNGKEAKHVKMEKAFQILMSNDYKTFLYGGGAGSGKSWCGCSWLLFMCLIYPKSRWFVARNEINKIVDSVYVTFLKVAETYGFEDFKFNAVKNFIEFGNGSFINFVEIKRKPSDPEYTSLGSTEYTGGWIEEAGEIDERGATVIITRVGRHLNDRFILNGKKLKGIVFLTCNPSKNWLKQEYYDKWEKNELQPNQYYLPALIEDNPFATEDYWQNLEELKRKDEFLYEKLRKGDWNFDSNPNRLCGLEEIEAIFENDHVSEGKTYLTADIARLGKDKAVIIVWKGWKVVEMLTYDVSRTTEIQTAIMVLRRKYGIAKHRCIADEDGVGGGVVDNTGVLGFVSVKPPIKEKGVTSGRLEKPNYRNIAVQCAFHLADKVNEGDLWVDYDITKEQKDRIKRELAQIISIPSDYGKLDLKRKSEIAKDIGGSPDYLDALKMRVYFDLKKEKRVLTSTWS